MIINTLFMIINTPDSGELLLVTVVSSKGAEWVHLDIVQSKVKHVQVFVAVVQLFSQLMFKYFLVWFQIFLFDLRFY